MEQASPAGERLQKVLAQAGYGSRRQIESLIRDGRIRVNGTVASLGTRVLTSDRIAIDDRPVRAGLSVNPVRRRVLAYYKPVGEVTTRSDPQGRPTVFENLPQLPVGRWISIGRLDLNTQGLLLLTTDGELAQKLTHPSGRIEREYAVRVLGEVSRDVLAALREGVELDDGVARFEQLRDAGGSGANHWYHVTLREGRHREVRRLWESQGLTVSRLVRVRYGPVTLRRGLPPGQWDELDNDAVDALLKSVGLSPAPKPGGKPGGRGSGRAHAGRASRAPASRKRPPSRR